MAENLAENLNRIMSQAKLSASELGRRLNMPAITIKKIRTGENTNPTLLTLKPIADYFKTSISQLIGDTTHLAGGQEVTNTDGQKVQVLPIINWEQAVVWPIDGELPKEYISVPWTIKDASSYALKVETNEYNGFAKGGILIISPKSGYSNVEYVLVHKAGNPRPSIKRLLQEDGAVYIQSVMSSINSVVKVTEEYNIIGVVLAYEIKF